MPVSSSAEPRQQEVAAHYHLPDLVAVIRAGLAALGKTPENVTPEDLAPVEEFHIGGRPATKEVLDQLRLKTGWHILDIGSGIGGPARFAAHEYGVRVTGIDLTPDYVETAATLARWVGLADRATFRQGSATALPFTQSSFDAAYMLHVGMNIDDKETLCREAARVLRPGALFAIYDVMRLGEGAITFPVPWAAHEGLSSVATPDVYKEALQLAGFELVAERNRRDFAIAFFDTIRAKTEAAGGPPPLGIHLVMGQDAPVKIANVVAGLKAGTIGPVELIARKRAG
ncbi:MAG TPA: class I SAM-dependent methyltransferase [Dongiaceae bacterium]|nr:class I SAM-dependent methyltransferase [Dongiaceae bacterium]